MPGMPGSTGTGSQSGSSNDVLAGGGSQGTGAQGNAGSARAGGGQVGADGTFNGNDPFGGLDAFERRDVARLKGQLEK